MTYLGVELTVNDLAKTDCNKLGEPGGVEST